MKWFPHTGLIADDTDFLPNSRKAVTFAVQLVWYPFRPRPPSFSKGGNIHEGGNEQQLYWGQYNSDNGRTGAAASLFAQARLPPFLSPSLLEPPTEIGQGGQGDGIHMRTIAGWEKIETLECNCTPINSPLLLSISLTAASRSRSRTLPPGPPPRQLNASRKDFPIQGIRVSNGKRLGGLQHVLIR